MPIATPLAFEVVVNVCNWRLKAQLFDYLITLLLRSQALLRYDPRSHAVAASDHGDRGQTTGSAPPGRSIYNVQEIYPDFVINQRVLKNKSAIAVMRRIA